MTRNDFITLINVINGDIGSTKAQIDKGGYEWTIQRYREFLNNHNEKLLRIIKSLHASLSVSKPDYAVAIAQAYDLEPLFATASSDFVKRAEAGSIPLSEIIDRLVSEASEEELDEAYKAFDEPDRKVHNYADQIQKLKKESRLTNLPGQSEIEAALDLANELLVSDAKHAEANERAIAMDRAVARQNKLDGASFYRNHKEYQPLFDTDNSGAAHISLDGLANNTELAHELGDRPFAIDPDLKQGILAVMQKMDELDLIPDEKIEGEQGVKVYAFHKYSLTRNKLVEAVNNGDIRAIEALTGELEKYDKKMEELYEFAETVLDTSPAYMPTNVDNFRNADIPPKFKQNQQLNAMINSIFVTKCFAKEYGITDTQMVDDPLNCVKNAITADRERFTPNRAMEAEGSLGGFLAKMTKGAITSDADKRLSYKWVRAVDIFMPATATDGLRESNYATYKHFQSYCTQLSVNSTLLTDDYASSFFNDQSKLMYAFFTPKDKLDLITLESNIRDHATMMPISQKFDFLEHIGNNKIDTTMLFNNIQDILGDYIASNGSTEGLVQLANQARTAIELVMLANPKLENFTPEETSLLFIHDNTNKYLDDLAFSKGVELPELDGLKSGKMINLMNSFREPNPKSAKALNAYYKKDDAFNKSRETLEKRIAKLDDTIKDPKTPIKKLDKLARSQQTLMIKIERIKAKQIKALDQASANGIVTDLYKQKRLLDIVDGDYKRRPSQYVEGLFYTDGKADAQNERTNAYAEKLEDNARIAYNFRSRFKIQQATVKYTPPAPERQSDLPQNEADRTAPEDDLKIMEVPGSDTVETVIIPPIQTVEKVDLSGKLSKPTNRTPITKDESEVNTPQLDKGEKDELDVPN